MNACCPEPSVHQWAGVTLWKKNEMTCNVETTVLTDQSQRDAKLVFPTSRKDFCNGLGQGWLFCNHEHSLHLVLKTEGPLALQAPVSQKQQ